MCILKAWQNQVGGPRVLNYNIGFNQSILMASCDWPRIWGYGYDLCWGGTDVTRRACTANSSVMIAIFHSIGNEVFMC